MQINEFSIDELIEYDKNPRNNDDAVDAVAESIKEFGFKVPVIVDKNMVVVAGHTRLKACRKLGIQSVPCIIADDLNEEQIKAFRLADNKVSELADWDFELLGVELDEIMDIDMSVFGFDMTDEEPEPEIVEDDFSEEVAEEATAKIGDIYQLGRHRLMCGDSSVEENIDILLNGENADLLFTDPPYGIKASKGFSGSGGFSGKGEPIPRRQYDDEWDNETPSKDTFNILLSFSEKAIIFGGNFFTDKIPQSNHWIVWNKHNTMPTFGDAELAWTNIKRNSVKLYDFTYNGLIGKEKERFHPTQKPVKLIAQILQDYTEKNDTVLDVFGGSGSTLIACEQLGLTCYMMELEPKYIDVIIKRWEDFTGEKAVLINKK